jgi:transcriptional repressor NrdR
MMKHTTKYMNCPYCNYEDTSVLESRVLPSEVGIRRRRQCKKCKKRFTTHEKVVHIDLKVIKKSGRVEQYDREKLLKGIKKACYKRKVEEEDIENVVDEIESKLLNRKTVEIKSSDIGKMVLSRLLKLDDLAYMRFASIYLNFTDARDFQNFVADSAKLTTNH